MVQQLAGTEAGFLGYHGPAVSEGFARAGDEIDWGSRPAHMAGRLARGENVYASAEQERTLARIEETIKASGSPHTSTRGHVTINNNRRAGFIVDELQQAAHAVANPWGFSRRLDAPGGGGPAAFHSYGESDTPDTFAVGRVPSPTGPAPDTTKVPGSGEGRTPYGSEVWGALKHAAGLREQGYTTHREDPFVWQGGWKDERASSGTWELDPSEMEPDPKIAISKGNARGEKGIEAMRPGGTLRLDRSSPSGLDESDEFTANWANQNRHRI
jgi:hypothetical protein